MAQPRIAFVNTEKLVYEYEGMKEAHEMFQQKVSVWHSNVDTLRNSLENHSRLLEVDFKKLSENEKGKAVTKLRQEEERFVHYARSMSEKEEKEEERMTQSVLNQINSFVKDYGETHGYDLILGTTTSGNILYGGDSQDITQEVLKALNQYYREGGTKAHP